jgi:DNA-binding PucR family transcriptional regulator
LRAAVLADPDVGEAMHARYIAPFEGRGDAILETVDRYLAEDCRLARTAAAMFLHANTVRYRLGRFEQETGASLRTPRSLAEVWWALERRRLR